MPTPYQAGYTTVVKIAGLAHLKHAGDNLEALLAGLKYHPAYTRDFARARQKDPETEGHAAARTSNALGHSLVHAAILPGALGAIAGGTSGLVQGKGVAGRVQLGAREAVRGAAGMYTGRLGKGSPAGSLLQDVHETAGAVIPVGAQLATFGGLYGALTAGIPYRGGVREGAGMAPERSRLIERYDRMYYDF